MLGTPPPGFLVLLAGVAIVTLILGVIYRRLWLRYRSREITPTGFGVFLPVVLLTAVAASSASEPILAILGLLVLAVGIYWLDDLRELSARVRMGVSFLTGAGIGALILVSAAPPDPWVWIGFGLAAGVLNVFLTNIVNFYDGADLNLATFIALTGVLILFSVPLDGNLVGVMGAACLAFVLPFAAFNVRPKMLYLGDAGSFAFSSVLVLLAMMLLKAGNEAVHPRILAALALPAFDTFYVLCVRVVEKHDLLTRNYLHLYQKLDLRYRGFAYLLPQVVNAALVVAAAAGLEALGWGRLWAVAVAMAVVTVPFYFLCRRLFLREQPAGTAAA
jgi:UDP-N-acetylmuramyl pentapeptide phosphotransferase/UDP-N-acetylglucosamine-1-phosphate transferase